MKTAAAQKAIARPETADVLAALSQDGHRSTEPRRRVIDSILQENKPFTAEQIVHELPDIGRATVYRTLELLEGIDVVARLIRPGGYPAYVVGRPGHRHYLVCTNCDRVVEIIDCPVGPLIEQLANSTEFAVESHHLAIFGVCRECAASATID